MSNKGWGIAAAGAAIVALLAWWSINQSAEVEGSADPEPVELASATPEQDISDTSDADAPVEPERDVDPVAATPAIETAPQTEEAQAASVAPAPEEPQTDRPVEVAVPDAAPVDADPTEPESTVAEAATPEPDTATPTQAAEAAEPVGAEAEGVAPDTAEPDSAEPETSEPDTVEIATAEPVTAEAEETAPQQDASQVAQADDTPTDVAEPAPTPTETETPEAHTATSTEAASETQTPITPTFDLIRVETDGSAIFAGRAEPGSEVEIISNDRVIGTAVASRSGEFVAMVDVSGGFDSSQIRLETVTEFGDTAASEQAVVVLAPEQEGDAPGVVLSSPEAAEIIQPVTAPSDTIVLDTITYSAEGEVVLTGRGEPGSAAFIYANDRPIVQADIRQDGNWTATVNTLDAGIYTLRVDEVGDAGAVTSRVESPFQREEPEAVVAAQAEAEAGSDQITVQPGNNLWTIARERYGEGPLYTVIFNANTDQIRDPDLIYPGQIFDLPQ